MGIGAAAEKPDQLLTVSMTGVAGQLAPLGAAAAPARVASSFPAAPAGAPALQAHDWWERHFRAEQRIRRWEREPLDPSL